VAPDGKIQPCTYWPQSHLTIVDLEHLGEHILETPEFQAARTIPRACQGCPCQGGCAGRRALLGQLEGPDPFCPFARGEKITIAWEKASAQDLPKAGSACTTIVSAR
jgi:radical SAM protein with 4Fe4S-binding SPASM domain